MLKGVFFDLDDTLFSSSGLVRRARWEACEAMRGAGLPAKSTRDAFIRLNRIVQKYGSNYSKHYNRLCELYKVKPDAKIISAGVVAYHNTKISMMHCFPHTHEMLIELVKMGLKLVLITNGIAIKQWEKIHRLRIENYFDLILISNSRNTGKSKGSMIRTALNKLGLRAEDVIFVGDKLDTDIASANSEKLISVHYIPGRQEKNKCQKKHIPSYRVKSPEELLEVCRRLKEYP